MRKFFLIALAGCSLFPSTGWAQAPESDVLQEPTMVAEDAGMEAEPETAPEPQGDRWYFQAEYLIWWLREGHIPPLLTTSSAASKGLLGKPDTRVLYGDQRLRTRHGDRFFGGRPTLGYWFDDEQTLGVEIRAFFLERDSTYFKAISNGDTLLARPYVNALDGAPMSEIVAGPIPAGIRTGGFVGYSRIELFGEEVNLSEALVREKNFRLDVLAGAHFLQMRDRLNLTATGFLLPNQTTEYGLSDHLRVDSRFFGGQTGLRGEFTRERWTLGFRGEVALGGTEQTMEAFGDRTYQTPLQKTVQPFGLAAMSSNSNASHTAFDAVYELGVNAGYQLTDHFRLIAGYTFLYWTNPIRAGDQVDLAVNPGQLTGPVTSPARPAIPFREDAFWAQGVSTGLEVRW